MAITAEFAKQIILVLFYVLILTTAVRLGIMFRKKKNEKEELKQE